MRPDVAAGVASRAFALDAHTRDEMQRGFGEDLGDVRLHADPVAARSAAALGATAYTVGNDVVFGRNAYEPSTPHGRWLIAHELTHVLQQHGAAASSSLERASAGAEREAHAAADAVVTGTARPRVSVRERAVARQDETEPIGLHVGGQRLSLIPGAGPLRLFGQRLPLPGRLQLTNVADVGSGPTYVAELDSSHVIGAILGSIDLRTSTVEGTPDWRLTDPSAQARTQLVRPVVSINRRSNLISGGATLHVPSGSPAWAHPGTDLDVRYSSSLDNPLRGHLSLGLGPLVVDAHLRVDYVSASVRGSVGGGPAHAETDVVAGGLHAGGTLRLLDVPITWFGFSAPSTRRRAEPLLGAPVPIPASYYAAGLAIPLSAGTVTSTAAVAPGFTGGIYGERTGGSLTAALLPKLDTEAISGGRAAAEMFPLTAYVEVSGVHHFSRGLDVGLRLILQMPNVLHPPRGLPGPQPGDFAPPGSQLQPPMTPNIGATIYGQF